MRINSNLLFLANCTELFLHRKLKVRSHGIHFFLCVSVPRNTEPTFQFAFLMCMMSEGRIFATSLLSNTNTSTMLDNNTVRKMLMLENAFRGNKKTKDSNNKEEIPRHKLRKRDAIIAVPLPLSLAVSCLSCSSNSIRRSSPWQMYFPMCIAPSLHLHVTMESIRNSISSSMFLCVSFSFLFRLLCRSLLPLFFLPIPFDIPRHGKCISLCALLPGFISMSRWSRFEIPFPLFCFRALPFLFFRKYPRKERSPSPRAPQRRRAPPLRGFGVKAMKGGRCMLRAPQSSARHFPPPADVYRSPRKLFIASGHPTSVASK